MGELHKDAKIVRAARRHLVPGETVLWARAQHGLGARGLLSVGTLLVVHVILWTGASLIAGAPGAIVFFLVLQSPFLLWWLMEMLAKSFVATDRRVIFISRMWPFSWSYWNYSGMDEHWIRLGKGRSIIHFRPFPSNTSYKGWQPSVYPEYMEQVPDIEDVRDLILQQIARRPEPVEKPSKASSRRPKISGTQTG